MNRQASNKVAIGWLMIGFGTAVALVVFAWYAGNLSGSGDQLKAGSGPVAAPAELICSCTCSDSGFSTVYANPPGDDSDPDPDWDFGDISESECTAKDGQSCRGFLINGRRRQGNLLGCDLENKASPSPTPSSSPSST